MPDTITSSDQCPLLSFSHLSKTPILDTFCQQSTNFQCQRIDSHSFQIYPSSSIYKGLTGYLSQILKEEYPSVLPDWLNKQVTNWMPKNKPYFEILTEVDQKLYLTQEAAQDQVSSSTAKFYELLSSLTREIPALMHHVGALVGVEIPLAKHMPESHFAAEEEIIEFKRNGYRTENILVKSDPKDLDSKLNDLFLSHAVSLALQLQTNDVLIDVISMIKKIKTNASAHLGKIIEDPDSMKILMNPANIFAKSYDNVNNRLGVSELKLEDPKSALRYRLGQFYEVATDLDPSTELLQLIVDLPEFDVMESGFFASSLQRLIRLGKFELVTFLLKSSKIRNKLTYSDYNELLIDAKKSPNSEMSRLLVENFKFFHFEKQVEMTEKTTNEEFRNYLKILILNRDYEGLKNHLQQPIFRELDFHQYHFLIEKEFELHQLLQEKDFPIIKLLASQSKFFKPVPRTNSEKTFTLPPPTHLTSMFLEAPAHIYRYLTTQFSEEIEQLHEKDVLQILSHPLTYSREFFIPFVKARMGNRTGFGADLIKALVALDYAEVKSQLNNKKSFYSILELDEKLMASILFSTDPLIDEVLTKYFFKTLAQNRRGKIVEDRLIWPSFVLSFYAQTGNLSMATFILDDLAPVIDPESIIKPFELALAHQNLAVLNLILESSVFKRINLKLLGDCFLLASKKQQIDPLITLSKQFLSRIPDVESKVNSFLQYALQKSLRALLQENLLDEAERIMNSSSAPAFLENLKAKKIQSKSSSLSTEAKALLEKYKLK